MEGQSSLEEESPSSSKTMKGQSSVEEESPSTSLSKVMGGQTSVKAESATPLDILPERLEIIFMDEIINAFVKMDDFKMFARSKNGLCLDASDVQRIVDDNIYSVFHQKMAMLDEWREMEGEKATAQKIRSLAKGYKMATTTNRHVKLSEQVDYKVSERLEDIFQEEIINDFSTTDEFVQFAQASLRLRDFDVQRIVEENIFSLTDKKMAMLFKWKEMEGEEATAKKIRSLKKEYFYAIEDFLQAAQADIHQHPIYHLPNTNLPHTPRDLPQSDARQQIKPIYYLPTTNLPHKPTTANQSTTRHKRATTSPVKTTAEKSKQSDRIKQESRIEWMPIEVHTVSDRIKPESKIEHMTIEDHTVSEEDISNMAKKILSSKELSIEFCDCDLTSDKLESLCLKIKDAKCEIKTLKVSFMNDIDEKSLASICFIVKKYRTTNLSFEYDELSDEHVQSLYNYLQLEKIRSLKTLDISYNKNISSEGYKRLAKIMSEFNIASLKATDCDITDEKLETFLDALHGGQMKEVNLSYNKNMTTKSFEMIGKFVASNALDYLKMSRCDLSSSKVGAFFDSLPQTGTKTLLKELDVSYNSTMEPDTALGPVVRKCGVTALSMAGCKLNESHVTSFRRSVTDHKMNTVNMRDNPSMSEGIVEVAKLVKQCEVEKLDISNCMFSAQHLKLFKESLGEAKLKYLHLGDEEREPDSRYISELCNLLANVEVLYLQFYKLSNDFRSLLKKHCEITTIKLKVRLNEEELCNFEGKQQREERVMLKPIDEDEELLASTDE